MKLESLRCGVHFPSKKAACTSFPVEVLCQSSELSVEKGPQSELKRSDATCAISRSQTRGIAEKILFSFTTVPVYLAPTVPLGLGLPRSRLFP